MGVTKEQVESSLTSKLNPSHLMSLVIIYELLLANRFSRCVSIQSTCSLDATFMSTNSFTFVFREVIDTSGGCGAGFAIEIVSEQFEGKRLLERHRMVNGALEEGMKQIHGLSIKKALTSEQWKQQQESEKSKSDA
ncbi:hypothetical protein SLE2022_298970 [Rubroshorea leprosula]